MNSKTKKILSIVAIIIILIFVAIWLRKDVRAKNQTNDFDSFITEIKNEALQAGVSKRTVDRYLDNMKPPKKLKKTKTIKDETHQAQAILTFNEYTKQLIPKSKVLEAKQKYRQHKNLLMQVNQRYGVPPQIIIALWGIESNFGRDMGQFPIIRTLTLLAYSHHRSAFFRKQLTDALKILDQKNIIPQMKYSAFDGGMGQTQFEPSSYLSYAVDFDNNGLKNIWTSLPDVFASIANYLHLNGWDPGHTWGIEVSLPKNFPIQEADFQNQKPISYWKKLGVKQIDGSPLPNVQGKTAIIVPDNKLSPAFLAYPNFNVLMRWNYTTFESLSVGIFASEIADIPLSKT